MMGLHSFEAFARRAWTLKVYKIMAFMAFFGRFRAFILRTFGV